MIAIEPKLLTIIQARLSSRRLPGKVLLPFGNSSILGTLIDRVSKSKSISRLLIATSDETSDDEICRNVSRLGHSVHRGHLQNVFSRFYEIVEKSQEKYILRITADCPLLSGDLIDETFEIMVSKKVEFLSNSHPLGIIKGFDLEFVTRDRFLEVEQSTLDTYQQEHVMPVFYENPNITKGLINYNLPDRVRALNLSIDSSADYEFLKRLENANQVSQLEYKEIFALLGYSEWDSRTTTIL